MNRSTITLSKRVFQNCGKKKIISNKKELKTKQNRKQNKNKYTKRICILIPSQYAS